MTTHEYPEYVELNDEADWTHEDPEATVAWSMAFENDEASRREMEADDARCGGSFSELLYGEA